MIIFILGPSAQTVNFSKNDDISHISATENRHKLIDK